MTKTELMSMKL